MSTDAASTRRFEAMALEHLDAAYNLARWLLRDPHDADDCVQEAWLRALRFFDGFRGGDGRAWLLRIVRNCCYDFQRHKQQHGAPREYDDQLDSLYLHEHSEMPSGSQNPELRMLRDADTQRVESALRALPAEFREVLILRELEALPYKQIAYIADVPLGTVMSRLARGRAHLRRILTTDAEA